MVEQVELERKVAKEKKVRMQHDFPGVEMESKVAKEEMEEMVLLEPVEAMEDRWCLKLTNSIWTYCILLRSKFKAEQEAIAAKWSRRLWR